MSLNKELRNQARRKLKQDLGNNSLMSQKHFQSLLKIYEQQLLRKRRIQQRSQQKLPKKRNNFKNGQIIYWRNYYKRERNSIISKIEEEKKEVNKKIKIHKKEIKVLKKRYAALDRQIKLVPTVERKLKQHVNL